jgi:hypothetical protein
MAEVLPPLSLMRELFKKVRETVAKRPVGIGTFAPEGVLESGRFRTQFEPGVFTNGTYDPVSRARAERILLGIPENIEPERRPVYGALRGVGPEPDYDGILSPPRLGPRAAHHYGNWIYLLSPEAKARSTLYFGDSLQVADDPVGARAYSLVAPLPQYALKDILAERPYHWLKRDPSTERIQKLIDNMSPNMASIYPETQTPGPVSLRDVTSIVRRLPNQHEFFSLQEHAQAIEKSDNILRRYRQEAPQIPVYDERRVLEDDDLARRLQLKARGGLVSALRSR